uniref:CCHC-type domain-containing protein n=1 Tax=Nicotiana tabacum TaxID=4097 RepID=A0A1S4C3J8_TOBAC|nr:PREDICTED: uncharacterized protein LOC107814790 [Nicotiana tabacum]
MRPLAALNSNMNYRKMVAFSQATENHKLKNRIEREGTSKARAQSLAGKSFQAQLGQQGTPPVGPIRRDIPAATEAPIPRCGKMYLGICYIDLPICYECGLRGHIQRECHSSRRGAGKGTTQLSSSAAATSSTPPPPRGTPVPVGRDVARGGA